MRAVFLFALLPRLFFAGDSTLDDAGLSLGGKANDPYRSWGTTLGEWMVPGASVANYARSGASTKSFDESGRWALMMKSVSSGDFVVIQFGHNDQKFSSKNRWAPPKGLFSEIVRKWVAQLRERGARPILVSPICRGTFDGKGRLVDRAPKADGPCLRDYRDALCELAEELHCDFVDMNGLTRELLERVGRDEAMKFFVISTGLVLGKDGEPSKDTTHPIRAGAEAFARLFLDDVRKRNLAVSALFRAE